MKNKKGFTLIELLAVIVILAIIALIAVPVIMNIINKANKSAFKDTAYGIISAGELYFAEQQLDLNGMSGEETFDFSEDNSDKIEVKGNVPKSTILKINEYGEIALAMSDGRYCITKGYKDKDITITENYTECNIPEEENNTGGEENTVKTLADITNTNIEGTCLEKGKTCTMDEILTGIEVKINVNDKKTYNFYVIADDGSKVTLIMDRNIGSQVAWYKDNDDTTNNEKNNLGPITVLNYLNDQINSETETWTNIAPIESYEYIKNTGPYGYEKLTITNGIGILTSKEGSTTNLTGTMRARLLTLEEVSTIKTNNNRTTPTWLYGNLSSSNTTEKPYGYWLLTPSPSTVYVGRDVSNSGTPGNSNVYDESENGARPVIELSK